MTLLCPQASLRKYRAHIKVAQKIRIDLKDELEFIVTLIDFERRNKKLRRVIGTSLNRLLHTYFGELNGDFLE